MKPEALDVFACPQCRGSLELTAERRDAQEIVEGRLRCGACDVEYPIRRGVPRFAEPHEGIGRDADGFLRLDARDRLRTDRTRRRRGRGAVR